MKKISILILLLSLYSISFSQSRISMVNWDISIPQGELKEFLVNENISLGGVSIDIRGYVSDNVTVGGFLGWDFFNGDSNEMFTVETETSQTDISGLQRFYVNYLPIMVNTHYYLEAGETKYYAGTGLGAVRTIKRTSIGTFNINDNHWHFGVTPEVGVLLPLGLTTSMNLAVKYPVAFKTSESIAFSYLSFNVGFASVF